MRKDLVKQLPVVSSRLSVAATANHPMPDDPITRWDTPLPPTPVFGNQRVRGRVWGQVIEPQWVRYAVFESKGVSEAAIGRWLLVVGTGNDSSPVIYIDIQIYHTGRSCQGKKCEPTFARRKARLARWGTRPERAEEEDLSLLGLVRRRPPRQRPGRDLVLWASC